jgi:hypothetical protein
VARTPSSALKHDHGRRQRYTLAALGWWVAHLCAFVFAKVGSRGLMRRRLPSRPRQFPLKYKAWLASAESIDPKRQAHGIPPFKKRKVGHRPMLTGPRASAKAPLLTHYPDLQRIADPVYDKAPTLNCHYSPSSGASEALAVNSVSIWNSTRRCSSRVIARAISCPQADKTRKAGTSEGVYIARAGTPAPTSA